MDCGPQFSVIHSTSAVAANSRSGARKVIAALTNDGSRARAKPEMRWISCAREMLHGSRRIRISIFSEPSRSSRARRGELLTLDATMSEARSESFRLGYLGRHSYVASRCQLGILGSLRLPDPKTDSRGSAVQRPRFIGRPRAPWDAASAPSFDRRAAEHRRAHAAASSSSLIELRLRLFGPPEGFA